jgi:hypothetical protein
MSSTMTTPEGTEFETIGSRVVFPDNDHPQGGGVALPDDLVTQILAFPGSGHHEETQTEWTATGDTTETRVGRSKLVEITQTSFGRERTVTVSLVDIGDANVEAVNS